MYTLEYYAARIKTKIIQFATIWMEIEYFMLSEGSQKEKDKYRVISVYVGLKDI